MIAQNDTRNIADQSYVVHWIPGYLEKLKKGKNVIFYPKNDGPNRTLKRRSRFRKRLVSAEGDINLSENFLAIN